MPVPPAKNFAEYAARFPVDVQRRLRKMRETVRKASPKATETIGYGMPAFRSGDRLVCFGAFARHIGFYPGASAIKAFKKQLASYETARGSVRFPFDQELPLSLIAAMVKYCCPTPSS